MMRVVVEVLPAGDRSRRRTLATVDIANVTGLSPISDYEVRTRINGEDRVAFVKGHRRSDGWRALLKRALIELEDVRSPNGGT
jgi:hypothetical protein